MEHNINASASGSEPNLASTSAPEQDSAPAPDPTEGPLTLKEYVASLKQRPTSASSERAPADTPWLTPGYLLFLDKLQRTRRERGLSLPELSERLGASVTLLERYESGELPLDFVQTRSWVSQLDKPVAEFTQELEDLLASTLDRDEPLVAPVEITEDAADLTAADGEATPVEATPVAPSEETTACDEEDSDPSKEPTIEVLVFQPGQAPTIQIIRNDLEAMQSIVEGLITVVHIDVPNCVAVANDEALIEGMPLNVMVPATQSAIFGPFLVALDTPPNFGSLSPKEVELVLDALAPRLSQTQFTDIVRSHSKGVDWINNWE